MTSWADPKVVAALKDGLANGLQSKTIGAQIGASASAVRAARHRLGLAPASEEAVRISNRERGRALHAPPRRAPRAEPDAAALMPLEGSNPRRWSQRRYGECAFPVGHDGEEILSCCNRIRRPAAAYCDAHIRILRGEEPPEILSAWD